MLLGRHSSTSPEREPGADQSNNCTRVQPGEPLTFSWGCLQEQRPQLKGPQPHPTGHSTAVRMCKHLGKCQAQNGPNRNLTFPDENIPSWEHPDGRDSHDLRARAPARSCLPHSTANCLPVGCLCSITPFIKGFNVCIHVCLHMKHALRVCLKTRSCCSS